MIDIKQKKTKAETLKNVTALFEMLVSKNIDVIIRHNKMFHSFVIFFDASTYKQAKRILPKILTDKTAEHGKTVYVYYK